MTWVKDFEGYWINLATARWARVPRQDRDNHPANQVVIVTTDIEGDTHKIGRREFEEVVDGALILGTGVVHCLTYYATNEFSPSSPPKITDTVRRVVGWRVRGDFATPICAGNWLSVFPTSVEPMQ